MAEPGTGPVHKGDTLQRIDGPVKVSGYARYAAEYPVDGMVWGVVVNSRIAKGRIDAIDVEQAHAVLHADGHLVVSSAASDNGTGTYTVMSQIAAASMGLALEQVVFQLGDSPLPVAPLEGGSSHVATVGSAIEGVCDKLKKTLLRDAARMRGSVFAGKTLKHVLVFDFFLASRGQDFRTDRGHLCR